ncbi:glutamate--cysteine ligase catalytic subunit-like isoform X2 [Mercenaria mercenaria]|uniref:glutamate--cysteine ligase catalytic subunit-like isoform X2 n=1 Tax=Mercenaria mercenaria TaxID=6596 RepID=UPI00234F64C1|nr:glutamate--cysteine ligase catalytic subunit-like isoform X2 [Mercenaria mercenaria]
MNLSDILLEYHRIQLLFFFFGRTVNLKSSLVEPKCQCLVTGNLAIIITHCSLWYKCHCTRLGCYNCTYPTSNPTPDSMQSHSRFLSEKIISHDFPKYRLFEEHIRERRGKQVQINIPVYKDIHTVDPLQEDLSSKHWSIDNVPKVGKTDHIFMDNSGFGAGSCCLQVTVQANDIREAKYLYDQFIILCPIMVALSAAAPVNRGYLSDLDTRWTVISQAMDDRTDEELGLKVLKENKFVINKSRYDSVDSYLTCSACSDVKLVYDRDIFLKLKQEGVDDMLSKHIAHVFIRDPLTIFTESLNQNDNESTGHFENIYSSTWQSVRFKLPAPGSNAGWQIEFRAMDVQLTDFENAAYIVFIILTSRVILTFGLNFVVPMSKADENFSRSHKRDAITSETFYFRNDLTGRCCCENADEEYDQMTVNEIVNGKKNFVGLVPLINKYLDMIDVDFLTRRKIQDYLYLVSSRASGKLKTMAGWIRDFVLNHQDYQQDSVVSETINYDLLLKCVNVSQEENFDFKLFTNEKSCNI